MTSLTCKSAAFSFQVDNRQKPEAEGGEESQDEEPEAKAVTVKFARRETAESKARRLASYDYLRKKQNEEAWIKLRHHPIKDPHVENERQYLYASQVRRKQDYCFGYKELSVCHRFTTACGT